MSEISDKGPNGRLHIFIGPHPAFATLNDDRWQAEVARLEEADRDIARQLRSASRRSILALVRRSLIRAGQLLVQGTRSRSPD